LEKVGVRAKVQAGVWAAVEDEAAITAAHSARAVFVYVQNAGKKFPTSRASNAPP